MLSFVRTALNHGAAVANYVEVERCERGQGSGEHWLVAARDRVTDRRCPCARAWWSTPPDPNGEPPKRLRQQFQSAVRTLRLDQRPGPPGGEPLSQRLWRRYGTDAFAMLTEIGRDPRLAEPVSPGTEYRVCELEHAARPRWW